jgi:hypothetical protein
MQWLSLLMGKFSRGEMEKWGSWATGTIGATILQR